MDTSTAGTFRRDARVIGLVATAHWTSHFLQLALPPLFVFLRAEFGVSYAALGALTAVFYIGSALSQFVAGFAVDRFGARPVLFAGMGLLAAGTFVAGFVPVFGMLYLLAALMGIGNGVFHPADFAVLNGRVEPRRLGHAYSIHGVGGSLGYALAPLASFTLASAFGWRAALMVMGLVGLGVLLMLAVNRRDLDTAGHRGNETAVNRAASFAIFRQAPILLCFAFFCFYTAAIITVQTFAAPALNAAHGITLAVATSAVSAYLLGSTAGIIAGGFLVGRTWRPERLAALGLVAGAVVMVAIAALPIPAAAAVPLLAIGGFALGSTGPSRDMLVRTIAPPGAAGRTYGFVYSGLDVGATAGPVIAGVLLDHHAPRMVFAGIAVFLLLAVGTALSTRRPAPAAAVGQLG
ncbi:MAG: MFS transporter [Casimicrobiaceae bacterium]